MYLYLRRRKTILTLFISIVLIGLGAGEFCCAQKEDSLRTVLNQSTGNERISTQLDLALHLIDSKNNESLSLAQSALLMAQQKKSQNQVMRAYYLLGRIHLVANNLDEAESCFDMALEKSDSVGEFWYRGETLFRKGSTQHRKGNDSQALDYLYQAVDACLNSENFVCLGATYSIMGTIFRINGLYDRAIEYTIKSKLSYRKADYEEGYAWTAYLLGRIYADLKHPEKALESFLDAERSYQVMASIDRNENGIAICQEQIGILNMDEGNYVEARKNFDRVLNIHTKSGSEVGISSSYKHIGMIEFYQGNYVLAENYLNKALVIKEEIADVLSLSSIYEYLGLSMIARGKTDQGIELVEKALELAIANNQKKIQIDIYSKLADIHLDINKPNQAIIFQNRQIEIQDSIISGTVSIKIEQLQSIEEIEEQNSQIKSLENQNRSKALRIQKQRNYQWLMVFGILVILLFSSIIIWSNNRIQRKNKELNHANTTKDKLFSIIAHDLKGPIGSADGLVNILADQIQQKDTANLEKPISVVQKTLHETTKLLNNLLDWAGAQLLKIEFNRQTLHLNSMAEMLKDQFDLEAEKKQIDIRLSIDDSIQVYADQNMLQTILRNLLSNAIKFSEANGVITFSAHDSDRFVQLSIEDKGVGIPLHMKDNLFNLEVNSNRSGTQGEKGTGLGLVLVKDFVEKHGGQIWVDSQEGFGSTFHFTLPHSRE